MANPKFNMCLTTNNICTFIPHKRNAVSLIPSSIKEGKKEAVEGKGEDRNDYDEDQEEDIR